MNSVSRSIKHIAVIFTLVACFICLPLIVQNAYAASGTCGDNLTWVLDEKVLTISGNGAMDDYEQPTGSPWYNLTIEKVIIEDGVTSIGGHAFNGCSSLTSITIPDSVTSIGYGAFGYCSSLTGITIPDSVTSIGEDVFTYCTRLESITIPDSVTSIGGYSFYKCSSLTSITIPGSVTSIGEAAFIYCSHLASITIPDSVTSIGSAAFTDCSSLTSITIPGSVTSIGQEAFSGCSGLTSVVINATSIGAGAFQNCSNLTSITIQDSVTSIGFDAFGYCSSLTSITIPDSVTSIGGGAFQRCNNLTSITMPIPAGNSFSFSNLFYGSVPYSLKELSLSGGNTAIPSSAFSDCSSLTRITIYEGVTSIGQEAFSGCSGLTSIIIPGNVTSIGFGAFAGCNNLTSITIPIPAIGSSFRGLFNGDGGVPDSLKEISLYGDNTSVPSSIFSGCSSLTRITISEGVTGIEDGAFQYCSSLTSITIPYSVTSIGDYAFAYCSSLTSITIPEYVTSIGEGAFIECNNMTDIIIPESVTRMSEGFSSFSGTFHVIKGSYADQFLRSHNYGDQILYYYTGNHAWNSEPTVDKAATCTENGSQSFHCSRCIETKDAEIIPAKGHSFSELTVDKPATCIEEGSQSIHCSRCNAIDESTVEVIPKVDHTYGDWITTKKATCKENGSKEKVCEVCKDKVTEVIPMLGHKWNTTYTVDEKATFSATGSKSYHCSVCNAIDPDSTVTIPKLTATLAATAYTYDGKVKAPAVTVKSGAKALTKNTNYTVTYATGRKNVGAYKVTVKMKGNDYSGSKVLSFKINPKGTTLLTPAVASKAITVKWKKQATKMSTSVITGYQIQLATDTAFTKNKKQVTVKGYSNVSKKVTRLLGGKRYYIRIRTYKTVGGVNYYSAWSTKKYITTKK